MKKTILLVDDEEYMRNMLGSILTRKGAKVFTAKNGEETLRLYKKNKPCCVFLDIKLPDINGIEVMQKLKEIDPRAKVYFLSGATDCNSQIQKQVLELGALGFISKPVDLNRIIEIVNDLLKNNDVKKSPKRVKKTRR